MTLAVSNAGDDGSFRRASRIFVRVSYLCMGPTRELGGCGEGATPSVQARDQAGRFVVNASELAIPLLTCDFEFLSVLNISTWLWSSRGPPRPEDPLEELPQVLRSHVRLPQDGAHCTDGEISIAVNRDDNERSFAGTPEVIMTPSNVNDLKPGALQS